MNTYREHSFIFSPRYRLLRHLIFWTVHILIFTFIFWPSKGNQYTHLLISTMWAVLIIIYSYPVMYWIISRWLLKEKYFQFALIMLGWAIAGWFWNYVCRVYIYFPIANALKFSKGVENPWAPNSYLVMNVMTGFGSMIVLFKYWMKKQNDFLSAEKEKVQAELQLLKAQIHPHFLFNTLNNIYSYSMKGSDKTTDMIARLSSLLSYILYDCKHQYVLLEKEIEVMNNYIELEKERYSNKLEVSINIEGDIKGKYIAPLLLLPFLENAFKHGTSDQLEKPWLSMDLSVYQYILRCKILNSKNDNSYNNSNSFKEGIGIENVKKRLSYIYPGKHELKLNDEDNFFVVSLLLNLESVYPNQNKSKKREAKPENIFL